MIHQKKSNLCPVIAALRTAGEVREFLGALLTPEEHKILSERWQIVALLLSGKTQREVQQRLGVGIATVTRGARELKYGNGAFQKYFNRMRQRRHSRICHANRTAGCK